MAYSLEQLEFLQVHIGVAIPPTHLENKRREAEFQTRREKVTADSGAKGDAWGLRAQFDGLLRGAADNAGKKKFDVALQLIDQAEALLTQPEPEPAPAPTVEAQAAAEITAEDFAALFEQDPDVLLKREWEQKKEALLPTLQAASEKDTPVKSTLTRIVLELGNLEKAGKFKEALAQLEKARAPLKTALEAKSDAGGEGGAARMEFIVARNKAINDITDAKASKGFGKPYTEGVKAIAGLEKAVQTHEAGQKWAEALAAVTKLHEHARSVLEISARTLKANADYFALDKTMKSKFQQVLGFRGLKGKAIEEKIAAAIAVGNAMGAPAKLEDFEEMLKQLQILETKSNEIIAAAKQYDLDRVAYLKQWDQKVVPKAAAAAKLTPPPASITKLREDMDAHNALIQAKVKDGDYPGASAMLNRLIELSQAVLDARATWEKEKKDFESALAKAKDQLAKAESTGAVIPTVGALRDTYATERKKMDGFVTANDFAAALPQLKDKVLPAIKPFLDARAEYDQAKKSYGDKKAALADKLSAAAGFTPATPELVALKEAHDKELKALAPLEASRDFTAATALLEGDVTTTLKALLAAKQKHDKAKSAEIESRKDAANKGAKAMLGNMKGIAMVDPSKAADRVEATVTKNKDLAGDSELKKLREEAAHIVGINADALKSLALGDLVMLEALENSLTQAITHCDTYQQAHKSTSKSKTDQDKFRQAEALRSSHEVLRLRVKTIRASFAEIEAKAAQADDLAKAEAAHFYGLLAKTGGTPEIKSGAAARQRAIMTALLKDAKSPDRVREIAEIIGEPALSLYKAQDAKPSMKDLRKNGSAATEQKKSKLQDPARAANVELSKNVAERLVTEDGGLDLMALHLQNLDDLDDGTPAGKTLARTLKKLRDDPQLQALFENLPAPQRDNPICDMLRATLGKKSGEDLSPADVKKAVLSAMLAALRQMDVGSCFATVTAIRVHDKQQDRMLKDMTEMLTTGAIARMAGGVPVKAPVQPRMSDAPMQTQLKLGKDGKLKSTNGQDLGTAQPLESTPAFSSAFDGLGIAGPKRKAALQTAQQDLKNQAALKAAMAKLPASIDDAAREKLRLAVLDRLATSPKASVKIELAKEVQKLKPQPPASDRKEIAKSAQEVLDAPEQHVTSAELLRQIAMRENGISDADLARLDKMKELRPKVMALQGDTTSPDALKLLDEYDALQKKIGAKAPQVAQFMKDLTAAQDGYLSQEDNRLLRCWEYTMTALAEQGISRKQTEQLNGATKEVMTDEFNAALVELDSDDKFKKATKKLDVVAIASALRDRYEALMPEILQTGYDASVEAALSSDGSSSRGAFYLFDTQGVKDPTRWIKIDDQSKYVTVVRGIVMLAWQELFEREKDKKKKEVSRTIADKLADRLSKESFVNAAKDKIKASTQQENQLPWQLVSGGVDSAVMESYLGLENVSSESTTPANQDELAEFVVGTISGMWDKIKDNVTEDPDLATVPTRGGPHSFNIKPGADKLQRLVADQTKTPQEKIGAFKSAEQADNRARLDAAASPQVIAGLKKKFLKRVGNDWDPIVQKELDKLANPTVKQASDAMEKAVADNYLLGLPARVAKLQQEAQDKGQPFDANATRQKLIDDRRKEIRNALAPALKEAVISPVKKTDQEKMLDKVIRKTGIDEDLVDAVRARALKTLGDPASTAELEAAVSKAMEAEGIAADGAMSEKILDEISKAHGPDGLVFADSNWADGPHRVLYSMVVNPLSGELEMWRMNEDGSGMHKMDPKTWVESGWDIKNDPAQYGGV